MSDNLKKGSKLGPWNVGKLVGEGACAKVYDVEWGGAPNATTCSYPVVAKVIPLGSGKGKKLKETTRICNTLNYERALYQGALLTYPYKPNCPFRGFYGEDKDLGVRYMVIEKLGCDLTSYANSSPTPPSHQDIAKIGLQILDGMKRLHSEGFLFVDSKPQNFMLRDNRIDNLVFVDFGCVERWVSYDGAGTRPQSTRALVGTPEFASLSCLKGNLPTRWNDLESMCLVLLSLKSLGKLPWNVAKSESECRDLMARCDPLQLGADYELTEVGYLLSECRKKETQDGTPDYGLMQRHLEIMLKRPVTKTTKSISLKSSPVRGVSREPKGPPRKKGASKAGVFEAEVSAEEEEEEEVTRKTSTPKRVGPGKGTGKVKASARTSTPPLNDDDVDVKPKPWRVFLTRSDGGHDLELYTGNITKKTGIVSSIGRGESNECSHRLEDDEYISDVHCSMRVVISANSKGIEEVKLSIKDEQTTNGTKVNNTKLARSGVWMPIHKGDQLKLGKTLLKVNVEQNL